MRKLADPPSTDVPFDLAVVVAKSALPVFLVRLDTFVVRAANQQVADLLEIPLDQIVGSPLGDLVVDSALAERALGMVASGMLDGYRATRRFRTAAGDVVETPLWVRSASTEPPTAIVILGIEASHIEGPLVRSTGDGEYALVVGTVDNDWRIDRISNDVGVVLHVPSETMLNARFTDLVHPDDLGDLLTAVGRALADRTGAAVRLRLRRDDGWLVANLTVMAVEPRDRARFAFVIGMVDGGDADFGADVGSSFESAGTAATSAARVAALERSLHRIAQEVHSAGLVERMHGIPDVASLPTLGRLSTREWEVLTDLTEGRRVADIASALHLSQSTVRNHLSAIFKKLNVRSQRELLLLLRESPADRTST